MPSLTTLPRAPGGRAPSPRVSLSLLMPVELRERLVQLAIARRASAGRIVREAVEEYLDRAEVRP